MIMRSPILPTRPSVLISIAVGWSPILFAFADRWLSIRLTFGPVIPQGFLKLLRLGVRISTRASHVRAPLPRESPQIIIIGVT